MGGGEAAQACGAGCGAVGAYVGSLAASVLLITFGSISLANAVPNHENTTPGIVMLVLGVVVAPVAGLILGGLIGGSCGFFTGCCIPE